MPTGWFQKLLLFTALLAGINASGQISGRQVLHDHVPAAARKLPPVGRMAGGAQLRLAIGLPLRNNEALAGLLRQIYDPASTNYHHFLTPQEFTARFGPTAADYQTLIRFVETNGLTVTATHPNRAVLSVVGAVTDIEKALHVTLRIYQHPKEARSFHAPDAEPSPDLTLPILHISGLDDYSLPHPNLKLKPPDQTAKAVPNAGSGPGGAYMGNDFRAAYVPGTSLTGAGQSVGLLQFDGYHASDIAAYATQAGLPNIPLVNVGINGGVTTPGSGNNEVCLDIEMVMAMAPGVETIYVYEAPNPSPWVDLLSRMANDNLAGQLSCSWGGGPPDPTAEGIFQQMAAQGQSFFNASGDSDAFTAPIEFPAESTNITQVGGTTLTTTGAGGSYVSETAWNWGNGTGSSGGVGTFYGLPDYQLDIDMTASLGSTTMRNVPDVALTGDHVYVTFNNGNSGSFGGTSCAAPLWAGFMALVNQQATAGGNPPAGFINPAVYAIGKSNADYATIFHDITTGDNFWSGSTNQYPAVAGYDLCTGWGTPNGTNLINALTPFVLVPLLTNAGATLIAESCAPTNGVIDPGETVTVNFFLKNIGTAGTTNLVVTLLATNGVTSPDSPQTCGVVDASGGVVAQPFSFTASGTCGGSITAVLQLQDGTNSLGEISYLFHLGQLTPYPLFAQNFDDSATPALPAGWTSVNVSDHNNSWKTSGTDYDTATNAAFITDSSKAGQNALVSPAIPIASASAQLLFRHIYSLEYSTDTFDYFDGGVLEIKIGNGSFTDILTAGGSFATGGYNGYITPNSDNPLGGRPAWIGSLDVWQPVIVNLPASAAGQDIQLRWNCATDNGNAAGNAVGWHVDTVAIQNRYYVCCTGASPDISSVNVSGNSINLTWISLAGQNYRVQYKTNLDQPAWLDLTGNFPASGPTLSTNLPIVGSQRFYRIAVGP